MGPYLILNKHIFMLPYSITLIKHVKRNGIAPRKWTKINVQKSKVSGKSCKRPLQKTRCEHNAANLIFSLKSVAA
jgi:hypothetical protein